MPQASIHGATPPNEPARPPSPYLVALEGRAPWELSATLALWPLLRTAPRGDGHPVIVYPGLAAADSSTALLRRYLQRQGYAVHRWGLGVNAGPRKGVLEACQQKILQLRERYDRKVSLVGWSLGGVFARELAKMLPDDVRQVISLGSPFTGNLKATNARHVYEILSGEKIGTTDMHWQLGVDPSVPTTSIYSRTDGIAPWQCSVLEEGPLTENIEVSASHLGLGANPAVLYAVADRLAQPEGLWKPFDKTGVRRWIYGGAARAKRA